MAEKIELSIQLRAFVRRDIKTRWIAVCPKLDIATQGTTPDDAKRQLDDAVKAWFEDCIERGTLDAAMRECGFRVAAGRAAEASDERVTIMGTPEPDVRGDEFSINVTIPAYQAAAILACA
jgi:hypothetical protein